MSRYRRIFNINRVGVRGFKVGDYVKLNPGFEVDSNDWSDYYLHEYTPGLNDLFIARMFDECPIEELDIQITNVRSSSITWARTDRLMLATEEDIAMLVLGTL